jgi:exodeoxyribonuclease-3
MKSVIRIATWNVNSIAARLPQVVRWLEGTRPDVLCMQETKCTDDKFPTEAFTELGYASESFGQPTYNGVAILSRLPFADVRRGFPDDEAASHARLLGATIAGIRVVNVYVPNGQSVGAEKYWFKLDWMKRLRGFFASYYAQDELVLLCGDFNVAPEDRDVHDPAFWRGRILFSDPEKTALMEIKQWGFSDVFRMYHQEPKLYSWWDYRAGNFRRNLGLRIDHIWTSAPLSTRCTDSWIDRDPRGWEKPSDHAPVLAEFDLGN